MVISDRIIHQIVVQISGLIKQNINFIGPDGIIRDSTDAKKLIRRPMTHCTGVNT